MKVLILHQFYNTPESGGALRSYYLARALADAEIQPIVISTHNQKNVKVTVEEGIEVHYLPVTYDNRYGFFKRVYSFLKFVWNTVRYAGKFRDVEHCYAISTPLTTGLAAIWIKFRYSIPYYFEVGDLWPEAPIQMGFVKNPILKFILFRLEAMIYKNADAVVALSPTIKESIEQRKFGKPVHLIPNMADTEFFHPEQKSAALAEKFNVREKFVVSYIGSLGLANGLDYVLECADAVKQKSLPIHFLICGNGAMKNSLIRKAQEKKLDTVSFIDFQTRDGVKDILTITDAALACYKPLPVLETGSPNKFFDGLAAGKLIILNFGGWLADEVTINACGISVDPINPQSFIDQVELFIQDQAKLKKYQQNARKLAEEKYARKIITNSFLGLFIKH